MRKTQWWADLGQDRACSLKLESDVKFQEKDCQDDGIKTPVKAENSIHAQFAGSASKAKTPRNR